ncbi:MAG: hypothetical protein IJ180_09285 [Bacteroidales bacterium]|nr:hypothetical protein [Bacteroidales bacterium]
MIYKKSVIKAKTNTIRGIRNLARYSDFVSIKNISVLKCKAKSGNDAIRDTIAQ